MKKILIATVVVILMLALATTVNAATENELLEYLTKTFTIAGEEVRISDSDRVKIERYLNENEVTAEQADSIIAKVDEAVAVMDNAGIADISKLSQADKDKLLSIANEAASVLGLTLNYDASSKTISIYKDGKLIESTSLSSEEKLVQTGTTHYEYVAIPAVALIAIAAVVVKKAKANA